MSVAYEHGVTAVSTSPEATLHLSDIIAEQALLLGAGSTVFHQLAVKGIGLGVAEHSTTLQRPVDRLRTTLAYVYVMILGTDEERKSIARDVNRMHSKVRSTGRYNAYDPELQLWVAATLARNAMFIHRKIWGPLSRADEDAIYEDAKIFGNALQVKPEMWPRTHEDFEAYWQDTLDNRIAPDPQVQLYCRALLETSGRPWILRAMSPMEDLLTRGNVDPRVREALGLTWTPRDQRRYDLFWRIVAPVYRRMPRRIRQFPAHAILADTRRRMAAGRRVI